jgi:threonine synthase
VIVRCAGCGAEHLGWACPRRREDDDIDHVLVAEVDLAAPVAGGENPFIRYRRRLASYQLWREAGRDDQSFVALVTGLDSAVAAVAGQGFRRTPLTFFPALDEAIGARVWVKDETGNVAGSHKGRHLFGLLLVAAALGADGDLAIASCGNAARAAAVLAAAAGRPLTAFVPPGADVEDLVKMGAAVTRCARDGRPGDPCYRRFREAVAAGAIPFGCQGPDNGFTIEGASTITWEVAEALPAGVDRVVVQVGGGALASGLARGFDPLPVFDTVQTGGAHPLERALRRLRDDGVTGKEAARHRSRYMWPWESEPRSVADGIVDDETYDWLAVAGAMRASGGTALVADEATLVEANRLARRTTGIDVDETGSAGLAGLLVEARAGAVEAGSEVLVLFTGGGRGHAPSPPGIPG